MEEYKCVNCSTLVTLDSNIQLFFFDICKHKICKDCLDEHLNKHNKQHCPLCKVPLTKKNVVLFDIEEKNFSNQKIIRAKLTCIFNKRRHNFKNTPLYNEYLEKVEDLIYFLSNEKDDKRKKLVEAYIKKYEKENSKIIEENNAMLFETKKRKIEEIVREEGNFYEIIKHRPFANKGNPQIYIHPLIKENPKIFYDSLKDKNEYKSQTQPRPLNPSYKNDTDIVPRKFMNKEELLKSDICGGYNTTVVFNRSQTEFTGSIYYNT